MGLPKTSDTNEKREYKEQTRSITIATPQIPRQNNAIEQ